MKINSTSTEGLSLKEAKKLMDNCKDGKLQLTVRKNVANVASAGAVAGASNQAARSSDPNVFDPTFPHSKEQVAANAGHFANYSENRPNYSNQNLYVQPPTRGGSVDYRNPLTPQPSLPHAMGPYEDKSNLSRMVGRSRGPLMDVSLSQLDQPIASQNNQINGEDAEDVPPRPPPPRPEGNNDKETSQVLTFTQSRLQIIEWFYFFFL